MARIQIQMPDHRIMTTSMSVRITDINYGNHMGHDALVSCLHEARYRLYHYLGFSENTMAGHCTGFISDIAVIYKAELFYGDHISISMTIDEFNKYGFDVYYEVMRQEDRKPVALAKTGIILYDTANRCIFPLPDELKEKIRQETMAGRG